MEHIGEQSRTEFITHGLILEPLPLMPDSPVRIPFRSFSVGHASIPLALVCNKNIMLALVRIVCTINMHLRSSLPCTFVHHSTCIRHNLHGVHSPRLPHTDLHHGQICRGRAHAAGRF
jgi:hypothetical protein